MPLGGALEIRGAWHRYGARRPWVLRDVTLAIEPGEAVALMGPSGSGKTTLLSILGLLAAPSEGAVLLDGRPLPRRGRGVAHFRAQLFAWVFQTVNVLPHRTAIDNAALGLLARGTGLREAREAASAALERVAMGALGGQAVHTLSGGELQRVCIARALAARPRFILADEPTAQLDRANALAVVEALAGNRPAGTAIVLATHDPLVASSCDRVIRLVDGAPAAEGAP